MTRWTGVCSVANLTKDVNYQDYITVDCYFNFEVTNHEDRCSFTFTYVMEVEQATEYYPNGTVKTWSPLGHLRLHDSHTAGVNEDETVTHVTYIPEPDPNFDYIRTVAWEGQENGYYRVKTYVKVDPGPRNYGDTLVHEREIEIDLRD